MMNPIDRPDIHFSSPCTVKLRLLTSGDGQDIYDMLQEIPAEEHGYVNSVNGMSFAEYKAWLIREEKNAKKTEIEDGWRVPQSTYWLYVGGKLVGQGRIRHFLTDALREAGGHIGYAIRPTERGKGYGTLILKELKREAAKTGIHRALVTVHNDNPASIRVAMKNGGEIERINEIRHFIWMSCKESEENDPIRFDK